MSRNNRSALPLVSKMLRAFLKLEADLAPAEIKAVAQLVSDRADAEQRSAASAAFVTAPSATAGVVGR